MTVPPPTSAIDWSAWLRRWDDQQANYIPEREERFNTMLDMVEAQVGDEFVALDLACGPGAIAQRTVRRFPRARVVAVDLDPVLLELGQQAVGDAEGRIRWVDADLNSPDWPARLGETQFDAVLSTTALHWLPSPELVALFHKLGALIRPDGIFLNGDHMQFADNRVTLRRLAFGLREERNARRFQEADAEDWDEWWNSLRQEPGIAALVEERERRFREHNASNERRVRATYEIYEAALHDAGFREVGTIWQIFDNRVIAAIR